jgi:hypothetical protein
MQSEREESVRHYGHDGGAGEDRERPTDYSEPSARSQSQKLLDDAIGHGLQGTNPDPNFF